MRYARLHVGEAKYELQQLHFHHPSEARIEGKLAVVAILFQEGAMMIRR